MSTTTMTREPIPAETLGPELAALEAGRRIAILHERWAGRLVATTSFGLQAAVMLHLMRKHAPEVPVVFVDTGYLFPETYRYAEELQARIGFEARVFTPRMSAARQEALFGKLWEQGGEGADQYARLNKIEPMNRALQEIGADVWISGLRRSHSATRAGRGFVEQQVRTTKIYPILDWTDEQVDAYFRMHELPRHPLAARGYATMGDWHSTRPVDHAGSAEETRFGGEKYECGLHLNSGVQDFQI